MTRLQWGRALAGAETPSSCSAWRPPTRFNGAAPLRARKRLLPGYGAVDNRSASMGPRPCGRGNQSLPSMEPLVDGGFNGAAPLRARKLRSPLQAATSKYKLQWGRALAGAETRYGQERRRRAAGQLQWGRALAGAETFLPSPTLYPGCGASMGPRPCGRGNPGHRTNTRRNMWCFNGAAPLRARKLRQVAADVGGYVVLQWGRALAGAETGIPADKIVEAGSFNGAAPLRARKLDLFVECA